MLTTIQLHANIYERCLANKKKSTTVIKREWQAKFLLIDGAIATSLATEALDEVFGLFSPCQNTYERKSFKRVTETFVADEHATFT